MAEDPVSWPLACGSFTIDAGHPCLPGHFPGSPVVPGVVLLDRALGLLAAAHPGHIVHSLPGARFRLPVGPAQPVAVWARPGRRDLIEFAGVYEGKLVFSGRVRLARQSDNVPAAREDKVPAAREDNVPAAREDNVPAAREDNVPAAR